jgi:hypothetical protein
MALAGSIYMALKSDSKNGLLAISAFGSKHARANWYKLRFASRDPGLEMLVPPIEYAHAFLE